MTFKDTIGKFSPPPELGGLAEGPKGVTLFINNAINLLYTFAALAVMVMLLWGAFTWITAGSDKDKLKSAQVMITRAIGGLIFLSLVFVILYILGTLLGFKFAIPNIDPTVLPKGAVSR